VLTNDDSEDVTVIEVLVDPNDEAFAFPISGILQSVAPAGQISSSVFGVILTS
jgi:hypothetical protein